jgi:hypothetical protein
VVVKNLAIRAIEEVAGITLTRQQMTVQGARVFLNTPSAIKSEVALKQEKVLSRMKEINPEVKIEKVQ